MKSVSWFHQSVRRWRFTITRTTQQCTYSCNSQPVSRPARRCRSLQHTHTHSLHDDVFLGWLSCVPGVASRTEDLVHLANSLKSVGRWATCGVWPWLRQWRAGCRSLVHRPSAGCLCHAGQCPFHCRLSARLAASRARSWRWTWVGVTTRRGCRLSSGSQTRCSAPLNASTSVTPTPVSTSSTEIRTCSATSSTTTVPGASTCRVTSASRRSVTSWHTSAFVPTLSPTAATRTMRTGTVAIATHNVAYISVRSSVAKHCDTQRPQPFQLLLPPSSLLFLSIPSSLPSHSRREVSHRT